MDVLVTYNKTGTYNMRVGVLSVFGRVFSDFKNKSGRVSHIFILKVIVEDLPLVVL